MKSDLLFLLAALMHAEKDGIAKFARNSLNNVGIDMKFWGIWLDPVTLAHITAMADLGINESSREMKEKLAFIRKRIESMPTIESALDQPIRKLPLRLRYKAKDPDSKVEAYIFSQQEGNSALAVVVDGEEVSITTTDMKAVQQLMRLDLSFTETLFVDDLWKNRKVKVNFNPFTKFMEEE